MLIQMQELRALLSLVGELNMLSTSKPTETSRRAASPTLRNAPQNLNSTAGKTNAHDSNYQIKRSADNMLRQNHCSGLHELLLDQITRSETLMQDNALM